MKRAAAWTILGWCPVAVFAAMVATLGWGEALLTVGLMLGIAVAGALIAWAITVIA
jgi:hypothetical protein